MRLAKPLPLFRARIWGCALYSLPGLAGKQTIALRFPAMCAPFNRAFIRAKPVSQKNWYKYAYLGDSDIYKPHIVAHDIT